MASKSEHIIALAEELLEDIELSNLPADALLLKTMRLARLADTPSETRLWLGYELRGYDGSELSVKYMTQMQRWINYEKQEGYWYPLAQVDANIEATKIRLQSLRVPDVSYSSSNPRIAGHQATLSSPVNKVLDAGTQLQYIIGNLSGIRARVLAHIHEFVVGIYHEKTFSGLSESIFEQYKNAVDAVLLEKVSEVFEKIPSIFSRLAEGDREAISHAMTTCRRMIDTLADAMYPPSDQPVVLDGNVINIDSRHHQNRLNRYVSEHTSSTSRRKRLKQSLSNIYDRVSSGVHNDIAPEEAQSIFLQTYLYLGEVVTLGKDSPTSESDESISASEEA